MMRGEYSTKGDEYIVADQATAAPWLVLMGNEQYGALLSLRGPAYAELATGSQLSTPLDLSLHIQGPGRRLYVRDNDTGEYWLVGSPLVGNDTPVVSRYGQGYFSFTGEWNELTLEARVFVPTKDPVEIWELTVKNNSRQKRRLSLFFLAEWSETFTAAKGGSTTILLESRTNNRLVGFLGCDHDLDSYETDRQHFFGSEHSYLHPQAVIEGRCSRTQGTFALRPGITVGQKNVTLGPAAKSEIAFFCGAFSRSAAAKKSSSEQVKTLLERYNSPQSRASSFTQLTSLSSQQPHLLRSPDAIITRTYNYWSSQQAKLASDSLFFQGKPLTTTIAARHLLWLLTENPEVARPLVKNLFSLVFKDGRVSDGYRQTSAVADLTSFEAGFYFGWVVTQFLKETGELDFLHLSSPYVDGGEGTHLEHFIRSLKQLIDASNELTVVARCQLVFLLRQCIPVLEQLHEDHLAKLLAQTIEHQTSYINRQGWDGGWLRRTTGETVIGSHRQRVHQIDLETQVWGLLSQTLETSRAERVLKELKKHLATPVGYRNLAPTYPTYDPNRVDFSLPPAGEGNNGGVNYWLNLLLARAQAFYQETDEALAILQCQPTASDENLATTPFLLPDNVQLSTAQPIQQAGFFSPVAGWWRLTTLEALLGIQATSGGLKIDPHLPREWRRVEVNRVFRGAEYHIRIENPLRIKSGIDRVVVDGERLIGNVIRPFRSGSHFVEVTLG